ncbi:MULTISPECIES: hypothetical protein [unclassified Bacillus (in: firmicutes)]|uniref:hypothetical protein n=1 Tax=unclassified Bacillus (in: firmicutes) TaxID=185979 RepID=UPI0008E57470|nr:MULTISPECIES: hypothetical protein [unclassified Bacillus (in: firmicutes)]SFA98947.1 hypothetical protein SAMN02799634_103397 [Bacillus sp. UNCCL13]SFQ81370.1 hypothetical protein SAMN04488577_2026 [Bacillus sp. cl95]
MNGTVTKKEELLMMLKQINQELDDLDNKVKDSFSGLKTDLHKEENSKLNTQAKRIAKIEKKHIEASRNESSAVFTLQAAL